MKIITPQFRTKSIENGSQLQIALPGIEKSAVTLTARDEQIIVETSAKDDKSYRLNLRVSDRLDATAAKAEFKNGLLVLSIPVKAVHEAKRIEVA